uniref:Zeta toxin n=1 Tax=Marseillevirus LCMAC101 TaxID=2506602 RepID=A0A481YR77_9VIRU|nr:MAG: zeta toxin [Marseillevirus LCMAC101]
MSLKPITIKTRDKKKLCLNISSLEPEKCRKGDPYHIFLIYRTYKDRNLVLISPFAGKCIGIGKDGKMVFSMGCTTPDDLLLHDDFELVNQLSECLKTGPECDQYILEETPNVRIWWNTPVFLQLESSLVTRSDKLARDLSHKLSVEVPLPGLRKNYKMVQKIDVDKKGSDWSWRLTITEPGKESIFKQLKANSVEGDKPVVWLGYRSSRPKIIFFLGSPGAGKSFRMKGIIDCFDLVNPIILSTDNVYSLIEDYKNLTRLGQYSDIEDVTGIQNLKATDSTIFRTIYEQSWPMVSKLKEFAIKNKIDIIAEEGEFIPLEALEKLKKEGYDPMVVILTINETQRLKNQITRFEETGRYGGSYATNFTKDKIKDYRNMLDKNGIYNFHIKGSQR